MTADGLLVVAVELALQDTVDSAPPLLLPQLEAPVGDLTPTLGARARRVRALLKGTLGCEALLALEVEFVAETAANTADGSGVSGH
jgi:hypothetical protein